MSNTYKVICENGDYWITGMNCDIHEARKYFIGQYKTYENFSTGQETKTKIIQVIDLSLRKDLLFCINNEGAFLGLKFDDLDLFMTLENIERSHIENWQKSKKDILEKLESYVILIMELKEVTIN